MVVVPVEMRRIAMVWPLRARERDKLHVRPGKDWPYL